jgi:hypothetical protein
MTKIMSNGDEILLVVRWQNATILQVLLPTWPQEPWRLSIQTSYCQHTSTVRPYYAHMNNSPFSYQELWNQTLIEGVLKSLGIPTPRNPHYQALAIFLVWPTPLRYPVIKYLASQKYNRDISLATTIQELTATATCSH